MRLQASMHARVHLCSRRTHVGKALGCGVGSMVVGNSVGVLVGSIDGTSDGERVGTSDGTSDGARVGRSDGTSDRT